MRKLLVFNHVTLVGYFVSANGDMRWAITGNDDPEYSAFVAQNASGGGEVLFGRTTYERMASFWLTPIAEQRNPAVAKGVISMLKVVFSKTLDHASWNNTTLIKGDLVSEICKLKEQDGPGMAIMGSGSIVAQLALENVIDEHQMMIDPMALGGPQHVRWHPGEAFAEADQEPDLERRQGLPVLRTRHLTTSDASFGYICEYRR